MELSFSGLQSCLLRAHKGKLYWEELWRRALRKKWALCTKQHKLGLEHIAVTSLPRVPIGTFFVFVGVIVVSPLCMLWSKVAPVSSTKGFKPGAPNSGVTAVCGTGTHGVKEHYGVTMCAVMQARVLGSFPNCHSSLVPSVVASAMWTSLAQFLLVDTGGLHDWCSHNCFFVPFGDLSLCRVFPSLLWHSL